ncbi:thiamine pyrophosphate-dependent enzyme [Paenibacillus larvae]
MTLLPGCQSLYEREVAGKPKFNPSSSGPVTQKRFWERLGQFLDKGDVLLAEQGTAFFGVSTVPLPEYITFVGQPLWGSIGYTLPALLGTCLASPERRHILIIGDGSFQLTAQELSTLMKHKLKPVIILINVERAIHGADQAYNDIYMWQYHRLPEVLGVQNDCVSIRIQNEKELDDALVQAKNPNKLMFLEVRMDAMDAPELLVNLGKMFAAQNDY